MYNRIGLPTPRGSGTSGHVTANRAVAHSVRSRLEFHQELKKIKERAAQPEDGPDPEILRHNKKREIYQFCESLREDLIKSGVEEADANKKIEEQRLQMLTKFEKGKLDINLHQTELNDHVLDELRQQGRERFAKALKIGKQYLPGSGFDFEAQERRRLEKNIAKQQKEIEELKRRQNKELQEIQEVEEEAEVVESEATVKLEKEKDESLKVEQQNEVVERMPTLIFTESNFQPQTFENKEIKSRFSEAVETKKVETIEVEKRTEHKPKEQQNDRFEHSFREEPLPKDHSESEDENREKRSKRYDFEHRKSQPEKQQPESDRNLNSQQTNKNASRYEESAPIRQSPVQQSQLGRRPELGALISNSDSESSLEDIPLSKNWQSNRKGYAQSNKRSEFENRKRRH